MPPPGQRWFLFNDSNVSSMEEADLAQEFSGKKSAYLLWYRRKNLPRPPEGMNEVASLTFTSLDTKDIFA
jgi:ubiquitin carboxyl-terminal hydrolase 40